MDFPIRPAHHDATVIVVGAAAMNRDHFKASLTQAAPPAGLSAALRALWWQRKGDWEQAHEAAQSDEGSDAAWVHALLHREEGDLSNAGYWYRRANRDVCDDPLETEWEVIVTALASEPA
jgi:hypothetical protein